MASIFKRQLLNFSDKTWKVIHERKEMKKKIESTQRESRTEQKRNTERKTGK